ncbi:MAG: GTPase HflX [Gemmatimonadetes bacterium]|nr:GTPase HflX [Gemmatimonadota bacterium]
MGAPTKDVSPREAEEHLEELARLTDTAGGEIVGVMRQRLEAPKPKYYIGEGKVLELRDAAARAGASLVIFDEDLTPAQGKNLEDSLSVRVMDRSELILDIFATRARTKEAKMQVELAQLEYLLPRLTRMWNHLSRIRGGIGLRGPGETQLETDRRIISVRITELKRKIEGIARARATQRKGRSEFFRAALVGYTNAGKSSILSALSGCALFVEDRLFATLDPATRAVDLGSGLTALVTDTVGFIRKLPHHLIASFRATLEEAREANLLLHVVDAAHSGWEEQVAVVIDVLHELDLRDKPELLVFNKIDRLTHTEEDRLRERVQASSGDPAVFVSAHHPATLEPLREALRDRIRAQLPRVHVYVPAGDGEAIATLYREGEVLERCDRGEVIALTARVPHALLGRLRQREGVKVLEVA